MLPKYGLAALSCASLASAWPSHKSSFDYFVVFGDSYTNDGFSSWYGSHKNVPPPPGVLPPQTSVNSGGGLTWAQFVGNYTGASIYDYASSGAACSSEIISRVNTGNGLDFASVADIQLPKFKSDTPTKLYKNANAKNTVYGLWIGTNDLGVGAFLTDSQHAGTDLTSYVNCIWSAFDTIYKAGGRRFVLLNNNALQVTPLYQDPAKGGAGNNNGYWPNKESYNMTEYNQKIAEYVATTNRLMDYGAPFNLLVKRRWPHASFALYNVHDLLLDIYQNPKEYLEAPYDSVGYYNNCPGGCPASRHLDGYMWYDALHPSNKTSKSMPLYCP